MLYVHAFIGTDSELTKSLAFMCANLNPKYKPQCTVYSAFGITGLLTVLTSETTSWDMSLWIAARHSWVIFGSLVPQPIKNGCTTSELFSFRAAGKGQR